MRPARSLLTLFLLAAFTVLLSGHAEAGFDRAIYVKKIGCPAGSKHDPLNRDGCWACPEGMVPTVFGTASPAACERPARSEFTYVEGRRPVRKNSRPFQGCADLDRQDPRKKVFFDVYGGNGVLGACYACPRDYLPTAEHVSSARKCEKVISVQRARAIYKRRHGCGPLESYDYTENPGLRSKRIDNARFPPFADPRNGGECWACPANAPYRTVNAVTGDDDEVKKKACAETPGEIFAADTGAVCRDIIKAIRGGAEAGKKLAAELDKLLAPVVGPIEKEINKLTSQIQSPRELDKVFDDMARALAPIQPALDEVARYGQQAKAGGVSLDSVMLNGDVICSGDRRKIDAALARAGINTNFKYGSGSGSARRAYHAFSIALMVKPKPEIPLIIAASFNIVTDFRGTLRNYVSLGLGGSTSARLEPRIGYMIFPEAELRYFEGIGNLGTEVIVGPGDMLDRFMARNRKVTGKPGGSARGGGQYFDNPPTRRTSGSGQYFDNPPPRRNQYDSPNSPLTGARNQYDSPNSPLTGGRNQYDSPNSPLARGRNQNQYDSATSRLDDGNYQQLQLKPQSGRSGNAYQNADQVKNRGQYQNADQVKNPGQYDVPTSPYGPPPQPGYAGAPLTPGYGKAPFRPEYQGPPQAPPYGAPPNTSGYGAGPPPFGGVAGRQYDKLQLKPQSGRGNSGQYFDRPPPGAANQYQTLRLKPNEYQTLRLKDTPGYQFLPKSPPPRLPGNATRPVPGVAIVPLQVSGRRDDDWFPKVCRDLGWCRDGRVARGTPSRPPAQNSVTVPVRTPTTSSGTGGGVAAAALLPWPQNMSIAVSMNPGGVNKPGIGLSLPLFAAGRSRTPVDVTATVDFTFRVGQ